MYSHSHFVKNLKYLISRMPQVWDFYCLHVILGLGFFSRLTILENYREEEYLTKAHVQGRRERKMNIQLEECKK